METFGREAYEWDTISPLTREIWDAHAVANLDFIPSKSSFRAALPMEEPAEPVPAPEVKGVLIDPKDKRINQGAKTVINRFLKNGWAVEVSYARGPWIMTRDWHVCDSILVRASYGEVRAAAQWIRKEWLEKDGDTPNWSNEIMRVNDNQGNPLSSSELKDLTLAAQYGRVDSPSSEGEQ
jgi:hypothetical protein